MKQDRFEDFVYDNRRKKSGHHNNGRNYLLIIICTLLFYYGCYSSAATYVNRQLDLSQASGLVSMYPTIYMSGVAEDPSDHVVKDFNRFLDAHELRNRLKTGRYRFAFHFLSRK